MQRKNIKLTQLLCSICLILVFAVLPIVTSCSAKSTITATTTATTTATSTAVSTSTTTATTTQVSTSTSTTTSTATSTTTATTTATTTELAPVAVTQWNLPLVATLTGDASIYGSTVQWYVNYAVSQINAAGGIRGVPVKITSYDDANNTSQAVLVVAQAVPGSLLLLGPNSITTMTAMESTIMNAKILDVGASREPSVRSQLAPYGIDSDPDLVANGIIGAKAWLALNPSIKRVGLLYYPAFPYPFGTQVPAALASLGVTVDLLPLSWGQTDFTPQATKGIANGDQGYIDESYPNGHITFAEALFNRGITQGTELFGGAPVDDPTLFTVGKGYLENSYLCQTSNPLNTSAAFTNMMAAYKASHNGSLPSLSTLGFYNAMYAIKATFETLGITGNPSLLNAERAEIASYLYNSPTFQGVQGSFQYTNGQNIASMYMLQIKNNQYTAVSTLPPQ